MTRTTRGRVWSLGGSSWPRSSWSSFHTRSRTCIDDVVLGRSVVRSRHANGRSRRHALVISRCALVLAMAALLAACGRSKETPSTATRTATPIESVAERPANPVSAANAYISSIALDARRGVMYLGTGMGMFRVQGRGETPQRVVGKLTTPGGAGSVSSNLFLRAPAPGELVASGHPEGGALPENLGLIRSVDGGATWSPLAQLGKADYHLLEVSRGRLVAVEAEGFRDLGERRQRAVLRDAGISGGTRRSRGRSARRRAHRRLHRPRRVHVDRRRPLLAPARRPGRRSTRVGPRGRALHGGSWRQGQRQHRRWGEMDTPRVDRTRSECACRRCSREAVRGGRERRSQVLGRRWKDVAALRQARLSRVSDRRSLGEDERAPANMLRRYGECI